MAPYSIGSIIAEAKDISLKLNNGAEDKLILRDVNFQIHDILRPGITQGQIVGILGPSGVGKTKLFEIMAGILKPTTGTVVSGTPLEPVKLGSIGVVQQTYPLFNHRTIWTNLMLAAKLCSHCEDDPKGIAKLFRCKDCHTKKNKSVEDILKRLGLFEKKDCYPDQLSGGQRQRVAIAQQMFRKHQFLLLDEPFSGLDINMTKEVSRMLVEIANQDELNTLIIVSHDIPATAAIADTLWLMGRDRTPEGEIVPGAYIKHKFDLMERGLAWNESSHSNPEFTALLHEVRSLFPNL